MRKLVFATVVLALAVAQAASAQEEGRGRRTRRGPGGAEALKRMDANGDGVISKDEFRGPEQMFARLDANGDGQVDEQEAKQAGRGRGQAGGPFMAALQQLDRDEIFNTIDTSGDGIITKDEFGAADFAKILGEALRKAMAKAGDEGRDGRGNMIERLDKNGDKKLSRDEMPERMAQRFDQMDADGDGFVTEEEMAEVRKRMRERRGAGGEGREGRGGRGARNRRGRGQGE